MKGFEVTCKNCGGSATVHFSDHWSPGCVSNCSLSSCSVCCDHCHASYDLKYGEYEEGDPQGGKPPLSVAELNLEEFFNSYVLCALWSSVGEDGDPLDTKYSADDIAQDAKDTMLNDCKAFVANNVDTLDAWQRRRISYDQAGHDFWLTRNGHGAGFWDRDQGRLGQDLTDACKPYGAQNLYVGDDGELHVCS